MEAKPGARLQTNRSQWCIGTLRTILLKKGKPSSNAADAEDNGGVDDNLYGGSPTTDTSVVNAVDGEDTYTRAEEDGSLSME